MPEARERKPNPEKDYAYSEWHRTASLKRFMPEEIAAKIKKMDLDSVEMSVTGKPLAFIEITEKNPKDKYHNWTREISKGHKAPALCVQIVLSNVMNPAVQWGNVFDISSFRVLDINTKNERDFTPQEYADLLRRIHGV